MADDEEPSSGEDPPKPSPAAVVSLSVPRWLLATLLIGWMLAIRLEMTTEYVARGRLEGTAILAGVLFGLVAALRFVTAPRTDEQAEPPSRNLVLLRFGFVFLLAVIPGIMPAQGILALVNRVGKMDDIVQVECRVSRLESRASLGGARRAIVHYTCVMPDGQRLKGHAPERMPAEPGTPLVVAASRGRLGVWLRHGPPETIAPAPAPVPTPESR